MNISIVINVTSASEAVAALEELKAAGILASVQNPVQPILAQALPVAMSRVDTLKREYVELHPEGRGFRLTKALKPLVESGQVTYEQVLEQAIAALKAGVVSSVNGSNAASLQEYVPEDDGEDTFA